MFRIPARWLLTLTLGAAGWAVSSGSAAAQYFPTFGGGFRSPGVSPFFGSPFLGSPYMGGSIGHSFFNPYTGGVFNYQYSPYGGLNGYSFFNPYTGQAMGFQAVVPYYAAAGYGGGGGYAAPTYGGSTTGLYGNSSNPITNQQLRHLRAASYQNAYTGGGYSEGRSAMSPRWTTAATEKSAAKPADFNEALLKSAEKDIRSGEALNALVAEIRKLEGKGAKAESPLLPAEVLARAAFENAESKDTLPAAPKWGAMGATVSEVIRHMDRNKLRFAPAPAGAEEAYGALHRGFLGYYTALASAKK